jgi:hypothetical protein
MYIYRVGTTVYVPSSGIGTPPPLLPQASVPPGTKGGAHSPAGRGWGSPNADEIYRKYLFSSINLFKTNIHLVTQSL